MEFELSTEQKIISLNSVKTQVTNEMFGIILHLGFDPDTFDSSSWEHDANPTGNEARLLSLISTLTMVDAKIAALS
jgi:hypothetical protein